MTCLVNKRTNEKQLIVQPGMTAQLLGVGAFNVVVQVESGALPRWLGETIGSEVAIRFTKEECGVDLQKCIQEIANAVFASRNEIGVQLYSVSSIDSTRDYGEKRYRTVFSMEKATCDLLSYFDACSDESEGMTIGRDILTLMVRTAKSKALFVDNKPMNILCFCNGSWTDFKLTDYDPDFFLLLEDRDWQSIMLVNLSFLALHVRNLPISPVRLGFLRTIAPILKELICRREEYESDWVFRIRTVKAQFDIAYDTSDFELQKLITGVCTAYFYGDKVCKEVHSAMFPWVFSRECDRPLICQMVEAATSGIDDPVMQPPAIPQYSMTELFVY
jgi:hypothetical protein